MGGGHKKETKLTLQAKSTKPELQPASHHTPGSGTLGLEAAHACVNAQISWAGKLIITLRFICSIKLSLFSQPALIISCSELL